MRYGALITYACVGVAICAPLRSDSERLPPVAISQTSAELRQIIASGRLSSLHIPDFRDIQPSLSALYEENAYAPLWLAEAIVTPKGEAIMNELDGSGSKGLNPEDYDSAALRPWAFRIRDAGGTAHDFAALDLALTVDLMRYAAALHQGRIDPHRVHFAIRPKDRLDSAGFVRDYLASDQSLSALLTQIEPPFRGYRNTLAALVQYRQLASQESSKLPQWPRLPLRSGQNYPDISTLAERLVLLGDLPSETAVQSGKYDGAIVDAVKKLQARHGLAVTGTLDVPTWRALTTPLSERVEQLELTLERWRWLPSMVTPAIVVNIPEFELRAYQRVVKQAVFMPRQQSFDRVA